MTSAPNPAFHADIAEIYDRLLVPLIFEHYADDIVARTLQRPGGAVLETACGTGVVTRRLERALPDDTRLIATDLNAGMLAIARAHTPAVEFTEADATALPFENDAFDVVVCQFGVMFYPDQRAGHREALRVLRPGGRLLYNLWESLEHNPLPALVHEVACNTLPDDPPNFMTRPFRAVNTERELDALRAAGFAEATFEALPATSRAPDAQAVANAFVRGTPLAAQLVERGVAAHVYDRTLTALQERYGAGPIEAPMRAVVFEATKAV